jgi:thymidylate synthase (FAD)
MKFNVLDKGYVRLAKINGSELDIVNAARLSYDNNSSSMTEADERLINFLIKEDHTSPFRHVGLSLEFKAPLMVARQHWRHIVGASTIEEGTPYSELSRRYVRGQEEFYIPAAWRTAPANSKQGSGPDLPESTSGHLNELYLDYLEYSASLYERMLDLNVAPEEARIVLPANAMYTKYLWSPSLHALLNFVNLRSAKDSQLEIQEYSNAVEKIIASTFPVTWKAYSRKAV